MFTIPERAQFKKLAKSNEFTYRTETNERSSKQKYSLSACELILFCSIQLLCSIFRMSRSLYLKLQKLLSFSCSNNGREFHSQFPIGLTNYEKLSKKSIILILSLIFNKIKNLNYLSIQFSIFCALSPFFSFTHNPVTFYRFIYQFVYIFYFAGYVSCLRVKNNSVSRII